MELKFSKSNAPTCSRLICASFTAHSCRRSKTRVARFSEAMSFVRRAFMFSSTASGEMFVNMASLSHPFPVYLGYLS